jgi:hypothetical protein
MRISAYGGEETSPLGRQGLVATNPGHTLSLDDVGGTANKTLVALRARLPSADHAASAKEPQLAGDLGQGSMD